MISESQWISEAAEGLRVRDREGLACLLLLTGGDRGRAWKFAFSMAKIGFCPGEIARAVMTGAQAAEVRLREVGVMEKSDAAQRVPTHGPLVVASLGDLLVVEGGGV